MMIIAINIKRSLLLFTFFAFTISLMSCSKLKQIKLAKNVEGVWDVEEYTKYKEGETAVFKTGRPYWHLQKYSQGFEVQDEKYYYRYSFGLEPHKTDFSNEGSVSIDGNLLIFDSDKVNLTAKVKEISDEFLWLTYREGGHILEFKYRKKD